MKPGQTMCLCGEPYWPKLAWKHMGCVAINTPSAINAERLTDAINTQRVGKTNTPANAYPESACIDPDAGVTTDAAELALADSVQKVHLVAEPGRTKNRRMREVYNAYMREYMKKRRKKPLEAGV